MDWVKEKMYQARIQRNRLKKNGHIVSQDNCVEENVTAPAVRPSRLPSLNQKLTWMVGGVGLGIVVVSIAWRMDLISDNDGMSGNMPEQGRQKIMMSVPSNTNGMEEELANLAEQVQLLTATVTDLQAKLREIHTVTNNIANLGKELELDDFQHKALAADAVAQIEILPPPAAGLNDTKMIEEKETVKSDAAAGNTFISSVEQTTIANGKQKQETIKESGPWVINLVSLPHKTNAESFVEKAESRGVNAGIYQVTVKGKTYWRVHVSGFATAAEAKSNADVVKEKLGLKDVWVAKR